MFLKLKCRNQKNLAAEQLLPQLMQPLKKEQFSVSQNLPYYHFILRSYRIIIFLIDSITLCCFLKEPSKNFFISIQFISRTIWILPGFNLIGSKLIVVDECIAPVIGGITNSLKQQQPCQFSHLFCKKLQTLKSNLELFSSILIIIT